MESISEHDLSVNLGLPAHTADVLRELHVKSASGSYTQDLPTAFSALPLIIEPKVCPILPSTDCFLSHLDTQDLTGVRVLDFGTGCGALAIAAAYKAAERVDAVDNFPEAVACARENAAHCNLSDKVHATISNGFSQITGRYDLILANIPIVYAPSISDVHDFGLVDEGWRLHNHLMTNYRDYLFPGGSAIVCHAPLQSEWSFDRFESYLSGFDATFDVLLESCQHALFWRLYSLS